MAGKIFEKRTSVTTLKVPQIVLSRTAEIRQVPLKHLSLFYLIGNTTNQKHL